MTLRDCFLAESAHARYWYMNQDFHGDAGIEHLARAMVMQTVTNGAAPPLNALFKLLVAH